MQETFRTYAATNSVRLATGSTAQIPPPVIPISIPEPDVPTTLPKTIPIPESDIPKSLPKPNIPYPSRRDNQKSRDKASNQMEKIFQIFQDLRFDISFADALLLMPRFAPTIKSLLMNKEKLLELAKIPLNENCSAMLLKKLPEKLGDPGKFLIPCNFPGIEVCHALADLGASINLMPLSIWKKLSLPELTPTRMTLELADRSITYPKGLAEDVFVKVGKFHFPTDFVVVDFEADPRVPLILGRSFLRTGRALIDVYGEEITLRVDSEAVTFNLDQTTRYSSTNDNSVNRIDIIDAICEEYAPELLGFPNSSGGNPTPTSEPFTSEFILEEIEAYLKDDSISPEIDYADCNPEEDICLIEKLLNNDPFQLPPMDLKQSEVTEAKSSIEEPPELELKDLSSHLEYAFLEENDKLPVIIAKGLKNDEKDALLKVLKSHKRAIAWKITDIKGIDPRFCTHKILMEDDYKPTVQSQRRVNPKIHEEKFIRASQLKKVTADMRMESSMEKFVLNDKTYYYAGISSITVNGKNAYELKGKFLEDLHNNAFSGTNRKDAVEHIEYYLNIVNPIRLPITKESITCWVDLTAKFFGKYYPPFRIEGNNTPVIKWDPTNPKFEGWLATKFVNYKTMDIFTKGGLWDYWKMGCDEIDVSDDETSDNDDEIAEVFRIDTHIFNYETPICSAFNEFNYLLKVDPDLLTKDIEGFKTFDDYKNDWIYEWNKDVPWVGEKPWGETGVWTSPTPVEHTCKPFNYKTGCSEWPTCSWMKDGYCNGGNLPGTYFIENQLHYQDYEWYDALEDSELKDLALQNKASMEKVDDDNELTHDPPSCNLRKYTMIKYSFNDDEEYVAVKEDEYCDLATIRK
ncbi:reverse transcriptase domain-containing protein [Tanacetum coccineum]|uniref:Reverse transcriptase domain-containing protein n=1 Tax=Tanacetum coccineum TaxID=301880 RepID=A0ABQ5B1L4_9ASTR